MTKHIFFLWLLILLASCYSGRQTEEVTRELLVTSAIADNPDMQLTPTIPQEIVNPLTGLVVEDNALLERRPLAVKISNDPRPMRPQWGLSLADIVYEYYTEWGKTRFIGVFYGKDADMVAPIRSARFFDENIVQMYKAVLAYVGADERVLKRFNKATYKERLISEWPTGCPPICRYDPKMWNHAYTNTAVLSQFITDAGIENGKQPLDGMTFAESAPSSGKTAAAIELRFSPYTYGQWVYDFSDDKYIRLQDKNDDLGKGEVYEVLNDHLNGEVVDTDNVVVLFVRYEYVVKKDQTEVVNMELLGKGRALLFRNAQVYDAQWKRASRDAVLHLVDAAGQAMSLKPGNTWFEVMGETSRIIQPQDGVFRFEFAIP